MKEFVVVCFQRVEPEEIEPVAYDEALEERKHMELLHPEDIFLIERVQRAQLANGEVKA